jgi:hypothetical protein
MYSFPIIRTERCALKLMHKNLKKSIFTTENACNIFQLFLLDNFSIDKVYNANNIFWIAIPHEKTILDLEAYIWAPKSFFWEKFVLP